MRSLFYSLFCLIVVLQACSGDSKETETVKLLTFKDRLSYSLGADHARAISESGDRFFSQYNLEALVKGFEEGLKNEKAFDQGCQDKLKKMYGNDGSSFDASMATSGSDCIGKLSATFFRESWKQKGAYDQLNLEKVVYGFKQGLSKADTLIARQEQSTMIQNFIVDMNKQNGQKMLDKAAKIPGVKVTPSGLVLETLQDGKGGMPAPGDDVLAHYILINANGDTLQSSFEMVEKYQQKLEPFSLLAVVPGWQEGIPMMKKGGKYRLYLPFNLAYGDQGMFNPNTNHYDIMPYESLYFYIELLNYGKPGTLK